MHPSKQQKIFKKRGVKNFYIGKSLDDSKRATVMFQGSQNVLYGIFINPKTILIIEAPTDICIRF